jgi:hypothetical protein
MISWPGPVGVPQITRFRAPLRHVAADGVDRPASRGGGEPCGRFVRHAGPVPGLQGGRVRFLRASLGQVQVTGGAYCRGGHAEPNRGGARRRPLPRRTSLRRCLDAGPDELTASRQRPRLRRCHDERTPAATFSSPDERRNRDRRASTALVRHRLKADQDDVANGLSLPLELRCRRRPRRPHQDVQTTDVRTPTLTYSAGASSSPTKPAKPEHGKCQNQISASVDTTLRTRRNRYPGRGLARVCRLHHDDQPAQSKGR